MIPLKDENPKGLYAKYQIRKIVGLKNVKNSFGHRKQFKTKAVDGEYFILRLDDQQGDPNHLRACRLAINTYADAIESSIPKLAQDLKERYPVSAPLLEEKR